MVCVSSKGSDQPAHTRSLIRALCSSLEYYMIVKLLSEHHLESLSLKGGCTDSSESTLVKLPHCWKSHVAAHRSNSNTVKSTSNYQKIWQLSCCLLLVFNLTCINILRTKILNIFIHFWGCYSQNLYNRAEHGLALVLKTIFHQCAISYTCS